ncbi:MAG: hypothetical protein ACR2GM_04065, partial [Nocardioidaceae bacterium]
MFGDVNSCLWIYEGAVAGSGATNDSCGAARIMPVSEFTNGQVGGSTSTARRLRRWPARAVRRTTACTRVPRGRRAVVVLPAPGLPAV